LAQIYPTINNAPSIAIFLLGHTFGKILPLFFFVPIVYLYPRLLGVPLRLRLHPLNLIRIIPAKGKRVLNNNLKFFTSPFFNRLRKSTFGVHTAAAFGGPMFNTLKKGKIS